MGKAEAAIESGAGLVGRRQPGEFATVSMEAVQHVAAACARRDHGGAVRPTPRLYQLGHLADAHQAGAATVAPLDAEATAAMIVPRRRPSANRSTSPGTKIAASWPNAAAAAQERFQRRP